MDNNPRKKFNINDVQSIESEAYKNLNDISDSSHKGKTAQPDSSPVFRKKDAGIITGDVDIPVETPLPDSIPAGDSEDTGLTAGQEPVFSESEASTVPETAPVEETTPASKEEPLSPETEFSSFQETVPVDETIPALKKETASPEPDVSSVPETDPFEELIADSKEEPLSHEPEFSSLQETVPVDETVPALKKEPASPEPDVSSVPETDPFEEMIADSKEEPLSPWPEFSSFSETVPVEQPDSSPAKADGSSGAEIKAPDFDKNTSKAEKVMNTEDKSESSRSQDTDNGINQRILIIDETATYGIFEPSADTFSDSYVHTEPEENPKSVQKKQKAGFNAFQIIMIVVFSIITLWFIMFTVDHTLAANGISPAFCRETEKYSDNSVSYKGLGYKVQFTFDADNNLTQKCLPVWKQGPNDGRTDISEN